MARCLLLMQYLVFGPVSLVAALPQSIFVRLCRSPSQLLLRLCRNPSLLLRSPELLDLVLFEVIPFVCVFYGPLGIEQTLHLLLHDLHALH